MFYNIVLKPQALFVFCSRKKADEGVKPFENIRTTIFVTNILAFILLVVVQCNLVLCSLVNLM